LVRIRGFAFGDVAVAGNHRAIFQRDVQIHQLLLGKCVGVLLIRRHGYTRHEILYERIRDSGIVKSSQASMAMMQNRRQRERHRKPRPEARRDVLAAEIRTKAVRVDVDPLDLRGIDAPAGRLRLGIE